MWIPQYALGMMVPEPDLWESLDPSQREATVHMERCQLSEDLSVRSQLDQPWMKRPHLMLLH